MEFLKRQWRQIQTQMGNMPANTKWVFGFAAICLVLALLLLLRWAGSTEYQPITQFAVGKQAEAADALRRADIQVKEEKGQLSVPQSDVEKALGVLGGQGLTAANTSVAFEALLADGKPWESPAQTKARAQRSKMQILSMMIGEMAGVRSANVIIDVYEKQGFGSSHVKPSAAVNVVMDSGRSLDRNMVEAIARLVSGAVAGMEAPNVQVIDANLGRSYTADMPGEFDSSDRLTDIRQREEHARANILEALRDIKNVIVAVNVQVDNVGAKSEQSTQYLENQPMEAERSTASSRTNQEGSAEPGTRTNTGLAINESAAAVTSEENETSEKTYAPLPVIQQTKTDYIPQVTKQINVAVRIPKSYLAALAPKAAVQEGEAQTETPLDEAFVKTRLTEFEELLKPLIQQPDSEGVLRVAMYDDGPMVVTAGQLLPGGSGVTSFVNMDMLRPVGLAILALTAIGIMFSMARKANQKPSIPSAAELAGVPPTLPTDDDLLGEVVESEPAMAGVEVREADIRSRKIANQISELIRSNPAEASTLFNKWVQTEE